ncbi:MAG: aminoacyl-tRNA hydrolase [Syntrophales bacterium]
MKCVVGLGNPGPRYRLNRHNAGFLVLDHVAQQHCVSVSQTLFDAVIGRGNIAGTAVLLAQPQTFMNLSGLAVRRLTDYFRIAVEDLIVVHDDLDLPFRTIRLKAGGGHGGHKGLISLIEHLGAADFLRVRVGIGRPPLKSMVESYVLSPFSAGEMSDLPPLIQTAAEAVTDIVANGIQSAMEKHHATDNSKLIKEG